MKAKHKITQEDISSALHSFLNSGGHINHLPDQEYKGSAKVGDDTYAAYESLSNLSKLTDTPEKGSA